MTLRSVPRRVGWAVETMAVRPDDHLLEIGCGRGTAVAAVCQRLASGRIVALDRSASMVRIAERRNQDNIASGTATFQTAALTAAELAPGQFDKIFAINVGLFWVGSPAPEPELVRRLLKPAGAMYLFHEQEAGRVHAIGVRTADQLIDHGFEVTTVVAPSTGKTGLVCVVARPRRTVAATARAARLAVPGKSSRSRQVAGASSR